MSGEPFGGRYSPTPRGEKPVASGQKPAAPVPHPFRGRRARQVDFRARMLFLAPLPLLFAGLGAAGRGSPVETAVELGGFAGLMLSAWLVNEGLRAEQEYEARTVARPPAIPRKLFAAVLTGVSIAAVGALSLGQGLVGGVVFGLVAAAAHLAAFGLDPMKKKGMEGVDAFATERVAKAIERAEELVRQITAAAARIGDRRLEGRIERLCDQAREVFRTIEQDPRDLTRARQFLNVYLVGLRDATAKFADLYGRNRDPQVREKYEALLGDLEASFTSHRADLLADNRSDLDVEIEVLRERLQQDGLVAR
jgi:5-bromo-4-chloroindolyl phosphate hydrolysis protein